MLFLVFALLWNHIYFGIYDLGEKYYIYTPQVRPDQGSNSWPPDHDSTFHVTETPALTTWPSVTTLFNYLIFMRASVLSWILAFPSSVSAQRMKQQALFLDCNDVTKCTFLATWMIIAVQISQIFGIPNIKTFHTLTLINMMIIIVISIKPV